MFGSKKVAASPEVAQVDDRADEARNAPLAVLPKTRWQRLWPVLACGSGLFSDGYVNNVIGSVGTILGILYGDRYKYSSAKSTIPAIAFAGTVFGQLVFGYTSDKWSRKNSLLISTIVLIVFTAMTAGSYGAGGSLGGLLAALSAYRFLVGIGIGGEYPAGSVACSEATGELKSGTRNRWFIMFTNVMIDWGFVFGAFLPYLLVIICGEDHLRLVWRLSLGLGVVPPLLLFYLRIKLQEPEEYKRESMKRARTPYWLAIKFYWYRLFIVSFIWFLYDFSSYSFGLYASSIVEIIIPNGSLAENFGWNTVINLFYIPGAMFGSVYADWIGPKWALFTGVLAQAAVGFLMSGIYDTLAQPKNIAGFCVVYGLFLSFGEVGPGDNIGLLASKTSATGVRGRYYAVAAALGKIGAFVGTKVFPYIEAAGGNGSDSVRYPFYVSSALCILTAFLVLFLPHVGQDTIALEDIRFREYLEAHGWDTNALGTIEGESFDTARSTDLVANNPDVKVQKEGY